MKFLTLVLGLFFSFHAMSADTSLLCNDQNSHSIYGLEISKDQKNAQLIALVRDSSSLSAGTKVLRLEEGESSEEYSTFGGSSNLNLEVALILNAKKAATLKSNEILEVIVYFQKAKGGYLSANTVLLCSNR